MVVSVPNSSRLPSVSGGNEDDGADDDEDDGMDDGVDDGADDGMDDGADDGTDDDEDDGTDDDEDDGMDDDKDDGTDDDEDDGVDDGADDGMDDDEDDGVDDDKDEDEDKDDEGGRSRCSGSSSTGRRGRIGASVISDDCTAIAADESAWPSACWSLFIFPDTQLLTVSRPACITRRSLCIVNI